MLEKVKKTKCINIMKTVESTNIPSPKYKGLKNGKEWESGTVLIYENGLAVIHRDGKKFYVFQESVSKFTGYTNAFGKEIYEGDLLEAEVIEENKKIKIGQRVYWDRIYNQWKVESFHSQNRQEDELLYNCLDQNIVGHVFTHGYLQPSLKQKQKRPLQEKRAV